MLSQAQALNKASSHVAKPIVPTLLPFSSLIKRGPDTTVRLLDNQKCTITWRGRVEQLGDKLISKGRVTILSKMDGGRSLDLPTTINKGKGGLLYFLIEWRPIQEQLPGLYARLKYYKLFASLKKKDAKNRKVTGTVLLQRLVLAADGGALMQKVWGDFDGGWIEYDAHHVPGRASGQTFLGHTTLDCRRASLECKERSMHRRNHRQDKRHAYGLEG